MPTDGFQDATHFDTQRDIFRTQHQSGSRVPGIVLQMSIPLRCAATHVRSLAIVMILMLVTGCRGQSGPLVLKNAQVIDTIGTASQRWANLCIEDGLIIALWSPNDSGEEGQSLAPTCATAPGARTIDLEGGYLLPGFIDLHVHFPPDSAVQEAIAGQLVRYGVTTVLNPGARPGAGVVFRDRPPMAPLRILTAGIIIDYRPEAGEALEWATFVASEQEVRAEVQRQVASGVDFIKYYASMPPALVAALNDEANKHGIPVIGHSVATTWLDATNAGTTMLVHSGYSTPMDELVNLPDPQSATDAEWYAGYADAPAGTGFDRLARALIEHEVTVVPTLAITRAGGLGKDAALLPEYETDLAPEAELPGWWSDGWRDGHPQYGEVTEEEAVLLEEVYWPAVLSITHAMYSRGVHLGVGSDVGNSWITPGASFHLEMELYQRAGIPAPAIITMATRHGAEALGLEEELGAIEVGKRADLVVLGSNPLDDIRNTRDIRMVFVGGNPVE